MVEKWELRPDPDATNKRRQHLWLKAGREDVMELIREFPNLCGRPLAVRDAGEFNWSIDMRSLSSSNKDALAAFLDSSLRTRASAAPQAPAVSVASVAQATPVEQAAPEAPAPREPELVSPVENLLVSPQESAPIETASAPEEPAQLQTSKSSEEHPPAPVAPPVPSSAPEVSGLEDFAPPDSMEKLEDTIDFDRGFDSLMVGPHNRFAHAASTSIVDSPASLYNPLFLFGPPGVGKTHLLQAIAAGLSQSLGPEGIILTSGFKLSCFLDPALGGVPGAREAVKERMRALIIDDFHLIHVTEANKPELAQLFAEALKKKCQIVASSLYAPKALSFLEQALGISFGRGWAVDLKVPAEQARPEIFRAFCLRRGLVLSPEEISAVVAVSRIDYAQSFSLLAHLGAFKKIREQSGLSTAASEVLPMLLDSAKPAPPELAALEAAKRFTPPASKRGAPGLALFFPQGQEGAGAWCLARFYQAASYYKFLADYSRALSQPYDISQGTPFEIGRLCRRARAKAALIVGPPPDSPLHARAAEFRHAVIHVLASAGVRAAWVAYDEIAGSAPFLRAHLDFASEVSRD